VLDPKAPYLVSGNLFNQIAQKAPPMGYSSPIRRTGSSWENGYVESFNRKMIDELLDREIFFTWKKPES